MKIKEIKDPSRIQEFAALANQYIHVDFPLEYLLHQCRVFALFGKEEEMCGGYVLAISAPHRVLSSVPEHIVEQDPLLSDKSNYEKIMEVTGLWLSPRVMRRASIRLWIHLYRKICFCRKKKYFLYAYSLSKPELRKIYEHAFPRVIYRGETKVLPGMSAPDKESVEIVRIKKFFWTPFIHPRFLVKRLYVKTRVAVFRRLKAITA